MNDDTFILDETGTVLIGVKDKNIISAIIPDGVTGIGDYAFKNCSSLTSIDIPNSVTSIGNHAFYGCTSLTSIDIPDSVTCIRYEAFSGCI